MVTDQEPLLSLLFVRYLPHKRVGGEGGNIQVRNNSGAKLERPLPTKVRQVRLVKAMVLPVVMYGCESWTIKKAECRRIDAFELWC